MNGTGLGFVGESEFRAGILRSLWELSGRHGNQNFLQGPLLEALAQRGEPFLDDSDFDPCCRQGAGDFLARVVSGPWQLLHVHVGCDHVVRGNPDRGQNGHLSVQHTDVSGELGPELGRFACDTHSGCELWRFLILTDGVDHMVSDGLAGFDFSFHPYGKEVALGNGQDFHALGSFQDILGALYLKELIEAAERG